MNTRFFFTPDPVCNSGPETSLSSLSVSPSEEDPTAVNHPNRPYHVPSSSSSFLIRTAMRVSRARWFKFLRRVYHYQNGSRSDLGSNPFNSGLWMGMEFVALVVQIVIITHTLSSTKAERPVWPMRLWIAGYDFGCVLSLFLLYWRFRFFYGAQGDDFGISNLDQLRSNEDSSLQLVNKCRTYLELFFALWFVMGNVWGFSSPFGSFRRAPKLHVLCFSLLAWNAFCYSFPFLLFVLLCCCVPLISNSLGYNMNMGSVEKGASDDQISNLPSWKFKDVDVNLELGNSVLDTENSECCICLAKYREKEEIRQLPCSHIFHLKCVDQWLKIISCCPLCKQQLER